MCWNPPAGVGCDRRPYSATDPHLLESVDITEVDSLLLAHKLYGAAPLDRGGRDAYMAEQPQLPLVARVPYGLLAATLVGILPNGHGRRCRYRTCRHPSAPWAVLPGARWSAVSVRR